MTRLIVLAAIALAGCAHAPGPGKDGYRFDRAEFVRLNPNIEFVFHPTAMHLQREARKADVLRRDTVKAWSTFHPTDADKPCRVHLVDPRVRDQPLWGWHEIKHCIFGRWYR